jgi:hypothetical protein
MAAHKLLLLPANPSAKAVGLDVLAGHLQANGLIGAPVELQDGHFYPTGDRFLQLITFLGCSPLIELEPPANPAELESASAAGRFCHVYLRETSAIQFRADAATPHPRCRQCRAPQPEWRTWLQAWRADPVQDSWSCEACGFAGHLTDLVFRKTAGFGKTWVEIRGIHPSEAVPGEALLSTLRSLTHCNWNTLYIKE